MQTSTRERLVTYYEPINNWAVGIYGWQNAQDYVHDGVVMMLLTPQNHVVDLTNDQFIGLWRLYTTKASILARQEALQYTEFDSEKSVIDPSKDAVLPKVMAGVLVRKLLPHLPLEGRKVIHRLYIMGDTMRECSTALGLSLRIVQRIKKNTIARLGTLVQQQTEEL